MVNWMRVNRKYKDTEENKSTKALSHGRGIIKTPSHGLMEIA